MLENVHMRRLAYTALLFLAVVPVSAESLRTDSPIVDSVEKLPEELSRGFSALHGPGLIPFLSSETPSFLKDSKFDINFRNYYFRRNGLLGNDSEAWAQGASVRVETGQLWDAVSFGAGLYGSYGLHAPADRDGSSVLAAGQRDYAVLGEMYTHIHILKHHINLGRREYNLPFLNRQDNRMTPNTFEAYTIAAKEDENPHFQYVAGYVREMKQRNSTDFVSMSEAAGAPRGIDRGMVIAGARYKMNDDFSIGALDLYTPDVMNILYSEAIYKREFAGEVGLKLSSQFIHQAEVGDGLLNRASDSTSAFGLMVDVSYRKAILTVALTDNSDRENIISPYGSYAGFNSSIVNDYNRAGETALRLGLSYDFEDVGWKGFSAATSYVWGSGAVDPNTRLAKQDCNEIDLTIDYKFGEDTSLKGLWLRLRGAYTRERDGSDLTDVRMIINYTL